MAMENSMNTLSTLTAATTSAAAETTVMFVVSMATPLWTATIAGEHWHPCAKFVSALFGLTTGWVVY